VAAAGFEPATKGFFSSRYETITENQERGNRDVVTNLDTTRISIQQTDEV
jgi:hypothetical protein